MNSEGAIVNNKGKHILDGNTHKLYAFLSNQLNHEGKGKEGGKKEQSPVVIRVPDESPK